MSTLVKREKEKKKRKRKTVKMKIAGGAYRVLNNAGEMVRLALVN